MTLQTIRVGHFDTSPLVVRENMDDDHDNKDPQTPPESPANVADSECCLDAINESSDAPLNRDGPSIDGPPAIAEDGVIVNEVSSSCNIDEPPLQPTVDVPSETSIAEQGSGTLSSTAAVRRRSSGTKTLFRSARAITPGAVAAAPTNGANTSVYSIDGDDESFHASAELSRSSFISRRESGTLPGLVGEEGEHCELESYVSSDDDVTTTIPPQGIVTAEVVEGDSMMIDQSERRRIVQETIQTISSQAVAAEVVHHNSEKSVRNYRAVILLLIFVVIIFAVVLVLVIVLTTRKSDSAKDITYTPTLSPTPFVDDSVFRTMEELYEAVDAYRMLTWNESNHSLFETSNVSLRYGYPISSWNVSMVTNFSYVFDTTRFADDILWEFNEDLGDWDVSNAEEMVGMFANAYAFQGIGLEHWNVGKVKDFSYMFSTTALNGTISGWDTSNAESMEGMFYVAANFNDDLSSWDVSRVKSMSLMFSSALAFEGSGLEQWNVRRVRDFSYIFSAAYMFNGTLSGWNTSSAENMEGMFSDASIFNDNLSSWDVSRVTNMFGMFLAAVAYTGDGIDSWDVSKVEVMDNMFYNAVSFNGDVSRWEFSRLLAFSLMVSALDITYAKIALFSFF
jgi:surface protein